MDVTFETDCTNAVCDGFTAEAETLDEMLNEQTESGHCPECGAKLRILRVDSE